MDKKSKIFFIVLVLIIVGSVAVTYWRIMIKQDYTIEAQTDCDPYTEACFVWRCDPESNIEGESCVGDSEKDIWYFKVIQRNASRIPLCDPNDENCDALICSDNEPECGYVFCTEDNMEAQYATACNDPIVYTEENPMEEECDQTVDAECVVTEVEDCDATTEDCSVEENVPAETADVVATGTVEEICDNATSDVCPIGKVESATPELE